MFSRQIGKKDVVNIAVHMDAESFVPLDRLCRGQGVVELTRLVPKPMNYVFVLVVPLLPTLRSGYMSMMHHVHEILMEIRWRFNDRRIFLYGRKEG